LRNARYAALRRTNVLFVGHDEAGENLAHLHTLVSTCELNRINPFRYLTSSSVCADTSASQIDDPLGPRFSAATAPDEHSSQAGTHDRRHHLHNAC
jgi:hypothetical protein